MIGSGIRCRILRGSAARAAKTQLTPEPVYNCALSPIVTKTETETGENREQLQRDPPGRMSSCRAAKSPPNLPGMDPDG